MHTPICRRTPDRLHVHDIVVIDDQAPSQIVRIHRISAGANYLIRTRNNLHHVAADALVELVAEWVPGVGFVVPSLEQVA